MFSEEHPSRCFLVTSRNTYISTLQVNRLFDEMTLYDLCLKFSDILFIKEAYVFTPKQSRQAYLQSRNNPSWAIVINTKWSITRALILHTFGDNFDCSVVNEPENPDVNWAMECWMYSDIHFFVGDNNEPRVERITRSGNKRSIATFLVGKKNLEKIEK